MTTTTPERVRTLRSFSRQYTRAVRALDEGHMASRHTLTETRVLFEVTHRDGPDAAELRRDLGLDASYLSRILARFESEGLVRRERRATDARRHRVVPTDAGRAEMAILDTRSDEHARGVLERFDEHDQARFVGAMATIESLLAPRPGPGPSVVLRGAEPGDLGWVVARNAVLYSAEYGFDSSYEALVARIVADFAGDHDPTRERVWIAEVDGRRAGAVFCVAAGATTAKLRLLLVEPSARGLGVGAALVAECVRFARAAGYDEMVLWTNDVLSSARRIYQGAGFELVDSEEHHSFGQDLTGQNWRLVLTRPGLPAESCHERTDRGAVQRSPRGSRSR